MNSLVQLWESEIRGCMGRYWRDLMVHATDYELAAHRVRSAGHLTYEQRSRLLGRITYLMTRADMRKQDIDIESVIAAEIRKESARR